MKKIILVIEDNPDNMALVEEILEDANYSIVKAIRAEDGIALVNGSEVDLILMDISLPEMDGLEATRIIKDNQLTSHIPIIGLSAHAMATDKSAAIAAGCDDYQTKPIDEEALLESINALWI